MAQPKRSISNRKRLTVKHFKNLKLIKMRYKSIFILILNIALGLVSYSQKIIVNGEESNGKLTWEDFSGKVDNDVSFYAFTSYKFNTKVGDIKFVGDSAIINGFDVILYFDHKKSWVKKGKETDALLIHEQGHFNVGILCVREIMRKFKEAKFTKANYNNLLKNIVSESSKKYNEMGLTYDEETDHSKNVEQQIKWNNFFSEELAKN